MLSLKKQVLYYMYYHWQTIWGGGGSWAVGGEASPLLLPVDRALYGHNHIQLCTCIDHDAQTFIKYYEYMFRLLGFILFIVVWNIEQEF